MTTEVPPTFEAYVKGAIFFDAEAVIRHCQVQPPEGLLLEREPLNQHDRNAIKVLREDDGYVGYIEYAVAARMSPWMDQGWVFMTHCIRPGILRWHRGQYYTKPWMTVRCVPVQPIKLSKKVRRTTKIRENEPA